MKKFFFYTTVLFFLGAFALSSCKSYERCPAYGQNDVDQIEQSEERA